MSVARYVRIGQSIREEEEMRLWEAWRARRQDMAPRGLIVRVSWRGGVEGAGGGERRMGKSENNVVAWMLQPDREGTFAR